MSAAKHTPGPWQAREWSCHAKTTVAVDDPSCGVTGVRVVAECETPQDARLIAAAPGLLEAVRAIAQEATAEGEAADEALAIIQRLCRAALALIDQEGAR